jgi:hypothetical protein
VGIHGVMPRRYEELDGNEPTKPRPDTWLALNRALGFEVPADIDAWLMAGAPGKTDENNASPLPAQAALTLAELDPSIPEVVAFLASKQCEVTIRFIQSTDLLSPTDLFDAMAYGPQPEKTVWFAAEIEKHEATLAGLAPHNMGGRTFYTNAIAAMRQQQALHLNQEAWLVEQAKLSTPN